MNFRVCSHWEITKAKVKFFLDVCRYCCYRKKWVDRPFENKQFAKLISHFDSVNGP